MGLRCGFREEVTHQQAPGGSHEGERVEVQFQGTAFAGTWRCEALGPARSGRLDTGVTVSRRPMREGGELGTGSQSIQGSAAR